MISIPLHILLINSQTSDIELIKEQVGEIVEKPHFEVVDDLAGCENKLLYFVPDVVISDYNLPSCDGFEVLELTRSIDPEMPFIFITGTIEDEDLAAHTILAKATGFILKKHMNSLDEKLKPLLKKIVYNIVARDDLRERIRKNKIAVNQIYNYLDELHDDNREQQGNIDKIRKDIENYKSGNDDARKT
ncbi:response regulator [Salegentibacter sp.]|uniref:response regulator n=1 Tax=Salegentibacter sp. TaxID=1903072 RepID=UPI0035628067